jgi:hypothetical protein
MKNKVTHAIKCTPINSRKFSGKPSSALQACSNIVLNHVNYNVHSRAARCILFLIHLNGECSLICCSIKSKNE